MDNLNFLEIYNLNGTLVMLIQGLSVNDLLQMVFLYFVIFF